jgi:uncharacterized membrane protein YdfJ with MMPL/SSD domain
MRFGFVTLSKRTVMEVNWLVIGVVIACAAILVVFLVRRNLKDEEELEDFLNKNDHPIKKEETEINDNQ